MSRLAISDIPYIRKVFFFTHGIGLCAGILFPVLTSSFLGAGNIDFLPFFFSCLVMGYATGACMYFFVRITLKKQLRLQLQLLTPLTGDLTSENESVEALNNTLRNSVGQVEMLVETILETIQELSPHYNGFAERSNFLEERASEGLRAATANREIAGSLEGQHRNIAEQMEILSDRTQDEAALSRELFASLQETASAMERSNQNFLDTTTSVDQMAASTRQVNEQATDFSRLIEGTVSDLQTIVQALTTIQDGATASSDAVRGVTENAESGLGIMNESIEEMDRIDEESQRATGAMQRLVAQTEEVGKIIEVIKDLVSDTELLAFNAAIIAAKAGAEGKGFSVVAGEIRDLADRTTTSAEDIQSIITAISDDTGEVTAAVNATASRITHGKQLSIETGNALRTIMESARESTSKAEEIAYQTGDQANRAHALIDDISKSLMSIHAIANAMNEQMTTIERIQEGTSVMKSAADQIARGMEEQVKANREFDQGLTDREEQIQTVNRAIKMQSEMIESIYSRIADSENRLQKNKEKVGENKKALEEMEILSGRLKELADVFYMHREEHSEKSEEAESHLAVTDNDLVEEE